jgi:hypothetical protein
MQNPAPPSKLRRTCPGCNRRVEAGNKFCETCGTRIPELSTCSRCGTQFISPVKYCDLCGAPVIAAVVPEQDDSQEYSEEEKDETEVDWTSKRDDQEIPEPDGEELPEDNNEEKLSMVKEETVRHYKNEILEPDTDELLEKYGKEYGEDETLESCQKPKSRSPVKHEPKRSGAVPAPARRISLDTVDDALFLSPSKQESPVKSRINKTMIVGGCVALTAIIIAAVYFIGLPVVTEIRGSSAEGVPPAVEVTPLPEPANIRTITPALTASRALVPLPTQLIPSNQKIYFQVQKNPVTSKISVIFAGSAGDGSIKSADIKVTHPDGSVATGIIMPLKGVTEITVDGSRETDRVEIIAQMSSGGAYRVYDELVPLVR